jgi:hypothetical protein
MEQEGSSTCSQQPDTRPHGVTHQETNIDIFTAVRISDLPFLLVCNNFMVRSEEYTPPPPLLQMEIQKWWYTSESETRIYSQKNLNK